MNWKTYFIPVLITASLLGGLSVVQRVPGYMDAEYYYAMGLRIANSGAFSEPFIWNFLSSPAGIPAPGFTYWMPLPALVAAFGMWALGLKSFLAAKIVPVALGAAVPGLTMGIAAQLTGDRRVVYLAGGLAVFPVFYSVYWGTTDSFGITMVLGGIFILLALKGNRIIWYILLGIIAGLMHLTRADGLIWLVGGLFLAWRQEGAKLTRIASTLLGYLLIMGPWFLRNAIVLGTIFPVGASRTIWLQTYDDLFTFHPEQLNFSAWWSQGLAVLLLHTLKAAGGNLRTLVFVQGQLLLFPFIFVGAKRRWDVKAIQAGLLVGGLIYILMSLVFPFAGARGGYFHSSAALQPLLWVLAADGFLALMAWGVKVRGWQLDKASLLFGSGLVVVLVISAAFVYADRVVGGDRERPVWEDSARAALQVEDTLSQLPPKELVMINNPPGFYAAAGRSAVAIPNGGVDDLLQAAWKYHVSYIVLESNHPEGLDRLYQDPESEGRLVFLKTVGETRYFMVPENE